MPDRRSHCLLVFFLCALSLWAQEDPAPAVSKDYWTLGVARLHALTHDPELLSIADLVSRRIFSLLDEKAERQLSDADRLHLAKELIDKGKREDYVALSSLYAKRDGRFFDVRAKSNDKASQQSTAVSIEQKLTDLRKWESMALSSITVPESLPIKLMRSGQGTALWTSRSNHFDALRQSLGFDALIGGSISYVGRYYGIRVAYYAEGETQVLWEGAVDIAEIEQIADQAASQARTAFLGRPWAGLFVRVEPAEATIALAGTVQGAGVFKSQSLKPGPVELNVSSPGRIPVVETVTLESGKTLELDLKLEKSVQKTVVVRTEPPGADIRLGNLWVGLTPMALSIPDTLATLTVAKKGFRSQTVPFSPDTESLNIALQSVGESPQERLLRTRRQLQNSILWFSLSVAPTIILLGVSENYLQRVGIGPTVGDVSSSRNIYTITNGVMWGSVSINVGLLGLVIYRIVTYLRAAEDLSDY